MFATIEVAMPEQPQANSSPIRICSNAERPGPPYSSGMWGFISPTSCALAITSPGCCERSSYSAATGRISRSAKSRASSRNARCSLLRAKEMPLVVSVALTIDSRVNIDRARFC